MTDPLTWSPISLGRWAGSQVRIHVFLIIFVAVTLLNAAVAPEHRFLATACWLGLLLVALAVHEFGHAALAALQSNEPEDVRLWPLGNMVGPSPATRAPDNVLVALGGLGASTLMVLGSVVALHFMDSRFVWSPFGNPNDPGGPLSMVTGKPVPTYSTAWFVGWFGYLNWVILLANLLPALPFDGGRIFRAYLAQASVTPSRDGMIPPLLARSCALILFVGGLVRLLLAARPDGLTLIMLAFLIEWMVRQEARLLEETGYLDEGVFGYDFSEGYTSLEAGTAKVRPYRESALKRWRRRRSELRRQRAAARDAAEEQRMDEILEKIHREGRTALNDEENRFLVRVSAKYRNKPRARD